MTSPLWRNRDFVLLQSGQLLSTFGSYMSTVAYPLLVLAVTHSAAKAGYVGAVRFAPMLVFSLGAGIAADRFDRRALMISSDAVAAAAVGTLAGVALAHALTFWLIAIVAFVDSTASVFFRAGSSGAFRAVVPPSQLPAAASVSQTRGSTVLLIAPPVGGALFAIARALPFLADAVSYVFSTASLLLMRTRFQEAREPDLRGVRRQLVEGLSFFARMAFLRTTMLMIAVSNFTVAGIQLAVIVLAKRHGLSSAAVGGIVALTGAGTLVGALASPLLRRVMTLRVILLSEVWAAAGYVAFLVWPNVYVLVAAFGVQAICFPNTDAAVAAYSYALIPDRLLGRAMSVSNTLRVIGAPLGPLAAGLLLVSTTPRVAIAVLMGASLAVASLATFARSIRDLPPFEELTASGPSEAATLA